MAANGELQITTYSPAHRPQVTMDIPSEIDRQMMGICLDLADQALDLGNPPIGAVLRSMDTQEHWPAFTTNQTSGNLLDHAEPRAYLLGRREHPELVGEDLSRFALYSTLELCPMCTSIFAQGKIGFIAIGASRGDIKDVFRKRENGMHEMLVDARISTSVMRGLGAKDSRAKILTYKKLRDKRVRQS